MKNRIHDLFGNAHPPVWFKRLGFWLLVGFSALGQPALAAVTFSPGNGTGAPAATLGPYTMTPFPADPSAIFSDSVTLPSPLGGNLGFSALVNHRRIGSGWGTWSHGYTGDVYYSNGATSLTLTLPAGTKAFYFYAEPNPFDVFNYQAVSNDGTSSGTIAIDGNAGAKFFGFHSDSADITSITFSGDVDFAIGEFGIAAAALTNVAAYFGTPLTSTSRSTAPVAGGPAGTLTVNSNFCRTGPSSLTGLVAHTSQLTNGNLLLSRTSDATPPAAAGAVGSKQTFVATGGYADGVLVTPECTLQSYVIGLQTPSPFTFRVNIIGAVGP